eukprot:CAMPEP_0117422628 /NCGR_PEP_ID=MMETSP0758-20121206/3436_1 /TAXON_ID=63605 /ORGANISM="Percolomonas cosmopolitus, Strain AE-1 (ATCC 50343)" /LENGTH=397 /DNA_ID=CAMNT_0005205375 /DNA_START=171 /DNA_END=1361 /DNA_ORIENTATION=-
MTILRMADSRYGHTTNYIGFGQVFTFGGYTISKESGKQLTNTAYIYENTFLPNRIQKGHYMSMGKWREAESVLDEEEEEDEDFDEETDKRKQTIQTKPCPRVFHTAVAFNKKIYVFGGETENKTPLNDLWIYDLVEKRWFIGESCPVAMSNHAACITFSREYDDEDTVHEFLAEAVGEEEANLQERFANVEDAYKSYMDDPYRMNHLCEAPNVTLKSQRMVVYGNNQFVSYNFFDNTWSVLGEGPQNVRGHSMNFYKGSIYIHGGYANKKVSNALYRYDTTNASCTLVNDNGPARTGHASQLIHSTLFIHFGHDGKATQNDIYAFNITTSTWRRIKQTREVHARWYPSLCQVNDCQSLLVGGANSKCSKALQNCELIHYPAPLIKLKSIRIDEEETD